MWLNASYMIFFSFQSEKQTLVEIAKVIQAPVTIFTTFAHELKFKIEIIRQGSLANFLGTVSFGI